MALKVASCMALLLACAPLGAQAQLAPTAQEMRRIDRILSRTPLIDGHNDLPDQILEHYGGELARIDLRRDTRTLVVPLQTDIPRLRQGRVGAQFWSVYVPADLAGAEAAQAVEIQIDIVQQMLAQHADVFEFAGSADEIVRIHRSGRIASMLGMEGGEPINANLAVLRQFRRAGVLYMTLCHARTTSWADSATVRRGTAG
jgi:membrane dipeptidase